MFFKYKVLTNILSYLLVIITFLYVFVPIASANEDDALTKGKAVEMLAQVLPAWQDAMTFDDTADKTAAYYRKVKVMDAEYDNMFVPDKVLTTEEFLVYLKRALDVSAPDLFYNNQNIKWHYDQNEVSARYQSQIAFVSAVGIYNNSGYLHPQSVISEGMASYYISLAIHTQNYGKRSKDGAIYQKRTPVLMYHVIDDPSGPYPYVYVSSYNFEQQIKYFYDNGYTFLFPEEISLAKDFKKSVVITFDDGYEQTYTNAYKILNKYNAKATLFMVSDMIGKEDYCTPEQLFEMSDSGVFRIYSHTKAHPKLTALTENEIIEEFSVSNDTIYNITGREVTSIAYPYGFFDAEVLSQAKRYYKTAFSVTNKGRGSVYEIPRSTIDDSISILRFPLFVK